MRKIILFIIVCGVISTKTYAVKQSKVEVDRVTLHNFSPNTFDASNMKMTINNQWFALNALTLISGTWNAPAGTDIVLGGFTLPLNGASVAIWYGSVDETNPSAFDMASYVQYGFAGNPFEALAASVSLWAAGAFVHGGPPLIRDSDWSSDGANHWGGTILTVTEKPFLELIEIGPVPFRDRLMIKTNQVSQEYSVEMFDVLGHMSYKRTGIKEEVLEVNTELLKQGVYFVRVSDNKGKSVTQRLIKRE